MRVQIYVGEWWQRVVRAAALAGVSRSQWVREACEARLQREAGLELRREDELR